MSVNLSASDREKLVDRLHSNLGFYINEQAEQDLAQAVEEVIERHLEPLTALADGWLAEIEDDGDGLTHLQSVLDELGEALNSAVNNKGGTA